MGTLVGRQWLGIEFRHLAALAAIAEEGSFRAAAERLGYVQSAVSQQVAYLERALDVRLVERAPGRGPVALTAAGELLLGHFEAILIRLGAARADVEALAGGRAGIVRLGVPANLEARIVPAALADGVRIEVTRSDDDAAYAALAGDRIDAALVSGPLPAGPFAARRLLEDPIVRLVRADAVADAEAQPLIVRHAARDTRTAAVRGRVVHATDDDATAHALVAAGLGAAILPMLSVDPGDDGVVALPLEAPPRVLSVVWHAEREPTPAFDRFLEAALAWASSRGGDPAPRGPGTGGS